MGERNKMEVKIIRLNGCMNLMLAVLTLGVFPLGYFIQTRSWPKRVDEGGLTTQGGKQIAWNEFTKITKVSTRVTRGSSSTVEHYELFSPKGKVIVAVYRLVDGAQVFEFITSHLPPQLLNQ
jgi:hypothetical protein